VHGASPLSRPPAWPPVVIPPLDTSKARATWHGRRESTAPRPARGDDRIGAGGDTSAWVSSLRRGSPPSTGAPQGRSAAARRAGGGQGWRASGAKGYGGRSRARST